MGSHSTRLNNPPKGTEVMAKGSNEQQGKGEGGGEGGGEGQVERRCCHCVAPLKQRRCASSRQRQSLQPVATSDTGSDCGSVSVSITISACVSKLTLAVLVSCQTRKFAMTANIASADVDSSSGRSDGRLHKLKTHCQARCLCLRNPIRIGGALLHNKLQQSQRRLCVAKWCI